MATNLVTNGDFPSNINDWDDFDQGPGTSSQWTSVGGGRLAIDGWPGLSYGWREQDIAVTSGKNYEVLWDLKARTAGNSDLSIRAQVGSTSNDNDLYNGSEILSLTDDIQFEFTATGTSTIYLQFLADFATGDPRSMMMDNVRMFDIGTTGFPRVLIIE